MDTLRRNALKRNLKMDWESVNAFCLWKCAQMMGYCHCMTCTARRCKWIHGGGEPRAAFDAAKQRH